MAPDGKRYATDYVANAQEGCRVRIELAVCSQQREVARARRARQPAAEDPSDPAGGVGTTRALRAAGFDSGQACCRVSVQSQWP